MTNPDEVLHFADNRLLLSVYGAYNKNLEYLEKLLSVRINTRGNMIQLHGDDGATQQARAVLTRLYEMSAQQSDITHTDIDRLHNNMNFHPHDAIQINSKTIVAKTKNQDAYLQKLNTHDLVFGLGPAGTGKTYLAVAHGVSLLHMGIVRKIILSRPAVEAGEHLGFLPGDMFDKIDPYLRPIHDALFDLLKPGDIEAKRLAGVIEIAPLAYMRGRTLNDAFILIDEAQNATKQQMHMVLTRLGENSRMVVTGDLSQIDLSMNVKSGLKDALDRLAHIDQIAIHSFEQTDIMRHRLVQKIVNAYENKPQDR